MYRKVGCIHDLPIQMLGNIKTIFSSWVYKAKWWILKCHFFSRSFPYLAKHSGYEAELILLKAGFDEWAGAGPEFCILPAWTPGKSWGWMLGGCDGDKLSCGWIFVSPWGLLPNVKHEQSSGQALGGDSLAQGWVLVLPAPSSGSAEMLGMEDSLQLNPGKKIKSGLWSLLFPTFQTSWHRKSSRSFIMYLIKEWKCGCFSFFSSPVRNEWGSSWQGRVLWWGLLTSFIHWDEQIPAAPKGGSFQGMQTCRGRASLPCSQLPKRASRSSAAAHTFYTQLWVVTSQRLPL